MKSKEYKNGWSVVMDKVAALYSVIVRSASVNVHDGIRCDTYRDAMDYWRAFNAIAKLA